MSDNSDSDTAYNDDFHDYSSNVKTPALIQLLVDGGLEIQEINHLSKKEFEEYVIAMGANYGATFQEIKNNLTERKEAEDEKKFIEQRIQERNEAKNLQQNVPEPLSTVNNVNVSNSQPKPSSTPIFIDDKDPSSQNIANSSSSQPVQQPNYVYRHVKNDSELVRERGLESINQLNKYRMSIVSSLIIPEGTRYSDQLTQLYRSEIQDISSGHFVAVNLPDGKRIQKYFHKDKLISTLYIWCAKQDSLMKDNIKLGHFILINFDGMEMDPTQPIYTITSENRILLFLRILY